MIYVTQYAKTNRTLVLSKIMWVCPPIPDMHDWFSIRVVMDGGVELDLYYGNGQTSCTKQEKEEYRELAGLDFADLVNALDEVK